jgi:hypothetical protein
MSQPLDDLLSLAERSYIRIEAEELIDSCLYQGDFTPFTDLVEGLVLAGSSSLSILREIHEAIRSVKADLRQEGLDIRQDLVEALSEFGVALPQLLGTDAPEAFRRICSADLHEKIVRASGSLDGEDSALIAEVCADAGARIEKVARRLALVSWVEQAVLDWMDGLAYEMARLPRRMDRSLEETRFH